MYVINFQNDICKITQVNEHSLIEKYIEEYLILLRNKIERYITGLMEQQSPACPATFLPSLEIIDLRLKESIHLHHIDLSKTVNYQLSKFKDIKAKENKHQSIINSKNKNL